MIAAILDHLWQSTLVALALGLLAATVFRKASAGVRYGLWFAGSVKFLVPFAALAMLGGALAPAIRIPVPAAPEAAFIETAARPFSLGLARLAQPASVQPPLAPAPIAPSPVVHAAPRLNLPAIGLRILLALWALGSVLVLVRWAARWTRVRGALRSATPLAWPAPMPVLASASMLEPGLIGLVRPVLLVPESLPDHLTQVEVAAIVAHEAAHLRRRDNVTAAVHMLVEALFWFHPLVWWLGARLITEREGACDEAVVRAGHSRSAYARSLLESARLYLHSPLDCVAGASGSDLKARVEAIMTAPLSSPLSRSKKALLLAAGLGAVATPVMAGLITSPEGQKAVAHAAAVASSALGVTLPAPDSDAAKPVVLARNETVLAPAPSVARLDVPTTPLTRDVAAPDIEAAPVQLAVATPPAPRPSAADRADAKQQAAEFVQAYAASTDRNVLARWRGAISVRVIGLAPEQNAAVAARVVEVAKEMGVKTASAALVPCQRVPVADVAKCLANVEIGFTFDPQGMLDGVKKRTGADLGDSTSPTRDVKTVTLPVQAWYLTNSGDVAQNSRQGGTEGLKVNVLYQANLPGANMFPSGSFSAAIPSPGSGGPWSSGPPPGGSAWGCCGDPNGSSFPDPLQPSRDRRRASPPDPHRAFRNVFVIVDGRRTVGKSLDPIADYVAMLALSQPRSEGTCAPLPSVTDLFASCPGRNTPEGLTPADKAYLKALYSTSTTDASVVADRMAEMLETGKLASR